MKVEGAEGEEDPFDVCKGLARRGEGEGGGEAAGGTGDGAKGGKERRNVGTTNPRKNAPSIVALFPPIPPIPTI